MIPILQFDPATLTLWYDTQLLATSRSSREIGLSLHLAIDGQDERLKCLVREQTDPWTQMRCATVASAVWHEKRHFLDFVLTNYGALRLRLFFQCYMNTPNFLSRSQKNGPLLLPLDRNLIDMRREMMGVSLNDTELRRLAEGIRKGKEMLLDDRRPVPFLGARFEVGGEAIFECIAYHVQLGKLHRVFGEHLNARVQRDNLKEETIGSKYQWAQRILIQSGLLKVTSSESPDGQNILQIDDAPMIPILYGALASRYHGQEQTTSEFVSSYHPGPRLASIVQHLDAAGSKIAEMSVAEAWEEVNRACKTIFGRSAIEETDADYAKEAELINLYANEEGDEVATEAYRDYHQLRGRFIELLKSRPEAILDQRGWADTLVNNTHPYVVAAAPAGVTGSPPEGHEQLSGYRDPSIDIEVVPDAQWWWTALRMDGADERNETVYGLTSRKAWLNITSDYAPLSKLMIDGNRMRAMVGPELSSAKIRIERETGVEMVMDALSRYPDEDFDISQWYFLTGNDRFRCQVTHSVVQAPNGRIIGPWEFRRKPAFREALLDYLGGNAKEHMQLALWRDWSPWLVCDQIGELFDAAKIDQSAAI